MIPKVIKTEEVYQATLTRIEQLMDAERGERERDELELLATLVGMYEKQHYPIAPVEVR